MIEILYPFELTWSAAPTDFKFCCAEEGPTTVELTARAPGEYYQSGFGLHLSALPKHG